MRANASEQTNLSVLRNMPIAINGGMLPFSFLPAPSRLAVSLLNALLKREDWARDRLLPHAGKTVHLAWGALALAFTVDAAGFVALSESAVTPDVTLTLLPEKLSLSDLLSGRATPDVAHATHIVGDAALAQLVADLVRNLRWDMEEALALRVGDVAALRLLAGVRALGSGVRTFGVRWAQNLSEFLSEERKVLTGSTALEQWRLDLAELSTKAEALTDAAAALDLRITALTAKRGA
jgi:ubiquinone biosynthesis protein UbiJ